MMLPKYSEMELVKFEVASPAHWRDAAAPSGALSLRSVGIGVRFGGAVSLNRLEEVQTMFRKIQKGISLK
jgi:hypothetical protein